MHITFDGEFEIVNIVTVQTDVATLDTYFQSMFKERFTFNWVHHQQQHCMTCLKIHCIEVLFNFCLVYMLLVVATQLDVSRENIFEVVLRPDPSCPQRKRNHHHLGLYHLHKMLPTSIFDVLTTNSSCRKETSDRHSIIITLPIDGSQLFSGALIPDSILEFVSCSCNKFECSSNHCGCAVVNLLCTELCGCTNWKSNDSQE